VACYSVHDILFCFSFRYTRLALALAVAVLVLVSSVDGKDRKKVSSEEGLSWMHFNHVKCFHCFLPCGFAAAAATAVRSMLCYCSFSHVVMSFTLLLPIERTEI
jgi:hypothetical protein